MLLQQALVASLAGSAYARAYSAHLLERQDTCSLPSNYSPATNPKLPNPFISAAGTPISTQAQWVCRQKELSAILQRYEYGEVPPKPTSLTASLAGTSLTINAGQGGKSISFSVTITKPSGTGPVPAIIAYGAASIPIPAGVATIAFNNDQIAAQAGANSRGQGRFYDLYGSGHSAGAIAAWAWGVSRIIDALELTPAAGIDVKRIGVTGCSRNGKGAFAAGAFDSRIALTIPQEPGAGGVACWRVSDSEKSKGKNIQTASQIITENPWFGTAFNSYVSKIPSLPHDHHELAALVAPRGLLMLENDIDWLGPVAAGVCGKVARTIYKAVAAEANMGYSQAANHAHCSFPAVQQPELTAFIGKFLLGQSGANTNVEKLTVTANTAEWVDWVPPVLSGSVGDGGSSVPSPVPPSSTSLGGPSATTAPSVTTTTGTTTATTPATTQPGSTAPKYGQCGGRDWKGPTICVAGTTCKVSNEYYSQCL